MKTSIKLETVFQFDLSAIVALLSLYIVTTELFYSIFYSIELFFFYSINIYPA